MGDFGPSHALNSDGPPPESVEQPSTERSARGGRQPHRLSGPDGFQQAGPPPWLFGAERGQQPLQIHLRLGLGCHLCARDSPASRAQKDLPAAQMVGRLRALGQWREGGRTRREAQKHDGGGHRAQRHDRNQPLPPAHQADRQEPGLGAATWLAGQKRREINKR